MAKQTDLVCFLASPDAVCCEAMSRLRLLTNPLTGARCKSRSRFRSPRQPPAQAAHRWSVLQSGGSGFGFWRSPIGSSADSSLCCSQPDQSTGHRDSRSLTPNHGMARTFAIEGKRKSPGRRNSRSLDYWDDHNGLTYFARSDRSGSRFRHDCAGHRLSGPHYGTRSWMISRCEGPRRSPASLSRTHSATAIGLHPAACFRPALSPSSHRTCGQSYRSIGGSSPWALPYHDTAGG